MHQDIPLCIVVPACTGQDLLGAKAVAEHHSSRHAGHLLASTVALAHSCGVSKATLRVASRQA